MELPCSSDRWEAESHQAWAALHPWTDFGPRNISFKATMERLFENGSVTLTEIIDDGHRTILMTMLARAIYDARESGYEAYPSPHATPTVERLLAIMEQFDRPVEPSSYILSPYALNAVIQQLHIRWGAYILATDNVCDYLHYIWAGAPRADEAQKVLIQWAQRDPAKVRRTALAAGRLFSIIRQYPCNHPWESYHTFHSAMFLWSVAGLFLSESPSASVHPSSRRTVCQLDWLGGDDSPEGLAIHEWVQNGGNHILRMHGVPDLVSSEGMQQLLQELANELRRKPVWGIAQNFLNAVLRILHMHD